MNEEKIYYIYIYLDPRKPGRWEFEDRVFNYEPFYVGKGKGGRIISHLAPASLEKTDHKTCKIKKIIRETGSQPIYYKIGENMLERESFALESKAIRHFGRLDLGTGPLTNLTDGGPGHKRYYNKNNLSSQGTNIKRASKKVIQKDQDKNILNIWNTVVEAQQSLCLKSITNIRKAISKKRQAYGFYWELGESSYTPKLKPTRPLKEVFQYDTGGSFIQSFPSAKHAEINLKLRKTAGRSAIQNCCKGKTLTAHGFKWFYELQ